MTKNKRWTKLICKKLWSLLRESQHKVHHSAISLVRLIRTLLANLSNNHSKLINDPSGSFVRYYMSSYDHCNHLLYVCNDGHKCVFLYETKQWNNSRNKSLSNSKKHNRRTTFPHYLSCKKKVIGHVKSIKKSWLSHKLFFWHVFGCLSVGSRKTCYFVTISPVQRQ